MLCDLDLDLIRDWDKRCGDNEGTFFPVTIDRRRLLQHVDELRAALDWLTLHMHLASNHLPRGDAPSPVIDEIIAASRERSIPVPING
jgi:hypothetical protein